MQPKRGAICDCDLGRPRPPPDFQRVYVLFVGADIIRPPLDLYRAGGVAEQAAVSSAEGGDEKQSEAFLDGVFLSSPILSFARKRKNGKKKKRVLYVGFLFAQRDADAALGPVSFLCLARKILERKNRFSRV